MTLDNKIKTTRNLQSFIQFIMRQFEKKFMKKRWEVLEIFFKGNWIKGEGFIFVLPSMYFRLILSHLIFKEYGKNMFRFFIQLANKS